jgi:hypothetical protein
MCASLMCASLMCKSLMRVRLIRSAAQLRAIGEAR